MKDAEVDLDHGAKFPWDASDAWWNTWQPGPPARDWAHAAARGVIENLKDRRGIKRGFDNIEEGIRVEIVAALAEIIRVALANERERCAKVCATEIAAKIRNGDNQ